MNTYESYSMIRNRSDARLTNQSSTRFLSIGIFKNICVEPFPLRMDYRANGQQRSISDKIGSVILLVPSMVQKIDPNFRHICGQKNLWSINLLKFLVRSLVRKLLKLLSEIIWSSSWSEILVQNYLAQSEPQSHYSNYGPGINGPKKWKQKIK